MPETHNCSSNDADLPKQSFAGISRRNFLSTFAIAAGSLGLTSISQSAQAASKKYKVCATKDVKVGGASSFRVASAKNMMVLITQPKKGVFRAFDQRCTHDGYAVNSIEGISPCAGGTARMRRDGQLVYSPIDTGFGQAVTKTSPTATPIGDLARCTRNARLGLGRP
jgi:nitrite reductase/ring-hydroxylating ferredoxin subunit